MKNSDIAVIGLGVMGSNLAINIASRGYRVSVFNRRTERTREFLSMLESEFGPGGRWSASGGRFDYTQLKENLTTAYTLPQLVEQLSSPRKLLLMIQAGEAIDDVLDRLRPLLSPGDLIIDGGNSFYGDTARRCDALRRHGLYFLGIGISGGAEGALLGPSLMVGGDVQAWPMIQPVLTSVAAVAPSDHAPCCEWMGISGAGHFVKMVHNGIEYAEMEAIAEVFDLWKRGQGKSYNEMAQLFEQWNHDRTKSYLLDITARILRRKETDGRPLLNDLLDVARQKGTGRWCITAGMNYDIDVSLLAAAVMQRTISTGRDLRLSLAELYRTDNLHPRCAEVEPPDADRSSPASLSELDDLPVTTLRKAFLMTRLLIFAQGFSLLHAASLQEGFELSQERIAAVWRAGCILRSTLVERIMAIFAYDPQCPSLLLSGAYHDTLPALFTPLLQTLRFAHCHHIATPVMSAALQYFLSMTTARLPLYLTQAQRDLFGAHGVELVDRPRGEIHHFDWEEPRL